MGQLIGRWMCCDRGRNRVKSASPKRDGLQMGRHNLPSPGWLGDHIRCFMCRIGGCKVGLQMLIPLVNGNHGLMACVLDSEHLEGIPRVVFGPRRLSSRNQPPIGLRSNQAGLTVVCLSTCASGQSLGLSIPALPAARDMMSCTKRLMESGCVPCSTACLTAMTSSPWHPHTEQHDLASIGTVGQCGSQHCRVMGERSNSWQASGKEDVWLKECAVPCPLPVVATRPVADSTSTCSLPAMLELAAWTSRGGHLAELA
ncbi:hypothetical protein HaLaN_04268 [Haematococcus lacustris]|uniref:Uncharacterized protein n=1 Tax=Haematococcus lacustris TaxID=44745 RepID=A0A699YI67_HAELA|nr:hypothetical protein HaLaN_04268 [Haematococcus lacustris]